MIMGNGNNRLDIAKCKRSIQNYLEKIIEENINIEMEVEIEFFRPFPFVFIPTTRLLVLLRISTKKQKNGPLKGRRNMTAAQDLGKGTILD